MPRNILCTVGTSLKTNADRAQAGKDLDSLVRFLRADLRRNAAETNVLDRLDLHSDDQVVLLHSATPDGALCAEAIAKVCRDRCHVRIKEIPSLGLDASKFKCGLRELNEELVSEIGRARKMGHVPLVNANGGFKAMIAHAVALGAILKVPVYYMHEQFDELIKMPPIPVDWHLELVASAYDLLKDLADGVLEQEFEGRVAAFGPEDAERLRQMAENLDGHWVLGNVGMAMLEQFEGIAEGPADAEVWMTRAAADKWEQIQQTGLRDRMRNRLEHVARGAIRRSSKHSSDALFYPAKGRVNERIMFFEDEPGKVVVYDLWTNHGDYERDMDAGRAIRARYGEERVRLSIR